MDRELFQERKQSNFLQAVLLVVGMGLVLGLLGWFFGGIRGVLMTVVVGLLVVAMSPRITPRLLLRSRRHVTGRFGSR